MKKKENECSIRKTAKKICWVHIWVSRKWFKHLSPISSLLVCCCVVFTLTERKLVTFSAGGEVCPGTKVEACSAHCVSYIGFIRHWAARCHSCQVSWSHKWTRSCKFWGYRVQKCNMKVSLHKKNHSVLLVLADWCLY